MDCSLHHGGALHRQFALRSHPSAAESIAVECLCAGKSVARISISSNIEYFLSITFIRERRAPVKYGCPSLCFYFTITLTAEVSVFTTYTPEATYQSASLPLTVPVATTAPSTVQTAAFSPSWPLNLTAPSPAAMDFPSATPSVRTPDPPVARARSWRNIHRRP